MTTQKPKVLIVPGNGGGDMENSNWYRWMKENLQKNGIDVAMSNMPDPVVANKDIWLNFIKEELAENKGDPKNWGEHGGAYNATKKFTPSTTLDNCIVVGHSSGAVAAMRLAELYKLKGIFIVAGYHSHLGIYFLGF